MTLPPGERIVRRVRPTEWQAVRDFRYEAVRDPDAGIAFLETPESLDLRDDEFWRARTQAVAQSAEAAQFVATDDQVWIGSLSVLARPPGAVDHLGRNVLGPRADVVGVYVRPSSRGAGVIDSLLEAAVNWAAQQRLSLVRLDVHDDNGRAQAAYRRFGFIPTGITTDGPTGLELEFAIDVTNRHEGLPANPQSAGPQ